MGYCEAFSAECPKCLIRADATEAIPPSENICDAIGEHCKHLPEMAQKAVVPVAFLALAMLGRHLLATTANSAFGSSPLGVTVTIEGAATSTLPIAAGLGSSAAFSVATAGALLSLYRQLEAIIAEAEGTLADSVEPSGVAGSVAPASAPHAVAAAGRSVIRPSETDLALINAWAYSAETLFHGAPSGLDNTVATYGGAIAYRKSPQYIHRVQNMPTLPILVTNTFVPKDTKSLVAGVRRRYTAHPSIIAPTIEAIEEISHAFLDRVERQAMEAGAVNARGLMVGVSADASDMARTPKKGGQGGFKSSGSSSPVSVDSPLPDDSSMASLVRDTISLVSMNQGLLDTLGVGHGAIDHVRATVREILPGAATKLTGAGGGGCTLTLLPASGVPAGVSQRLTEALESQSWNREGLLNLRNFKCVETRMAGAGVLVEQSADLDISVDSVRSKPVAEIVTGVYVSRRMQAQIDAEAQRGAMKKRLASTVSVLTIAGVATALAASFMKRSPAT